MNMIEAGKWFTLEVRKLGAVFGPYFINAALVCFQIQKLTRLNPIHPIAVVRILRQPLIIEGLLGHSHMR